MRALVTGIGTFWGSRIAQELEGRDDVEVVVGLGTNEPVLPLERTEYVRADSGYTILQRLVHATQVDTIVHTHLMVDSTQLGGRAMHEINVIGTMNLLAAAGTAGSPIRKVVVKSSTLVYGAGKSDPYVFREEAKRTTPARTPVERSLLEVESFVSDFSEDNPHVTVTLLRFTNILGDHMQTPFASALRLPVVPEIFGFDPLLQFTHEDDACAALVFACLNEIPGVYNVGGDGTIPWSEVCTIVGKRRVALPPVLTGLAAEPLRMLRVLDLPSELLTLLRYGKGVDNSRLKRAGFRYRYSTVGAVEDFARGLRLESTVGDRTPAYRYQRDVETFFRHSPAVVRDHE
ncbi:MAG TPA: NAD-dependent epimerase/dehydratase family protein [Acidimicrobiia bacterium]